MPQNRSGSSDDSRGGTAQERSGDPNQRQQRQQDDSVDSATRWFATTAVRTGLTVIGVVLLLFALGRAVGLPLLELVTDALTAQTGQWLVIAFFAVLLIGAAQKTATTG